ncbi:MAG: HNH endonuclease signature motif containing protein [Ornithinimicrobium sp.]
MDTLPDTVETFVDDERQPAHWELDELGLSPEQWKDIEDPAGVVCSMAQVDHALSRLPLPPGVADALTAVLACAVAHAESTIADPQEADSDSLLDAAAGVRVVQGFSDAVMVQAAATLAERAGTELLGRKGVRDPDELASSARERWRAKTKSVVAQELSVLTGLGVQAAHARVAFALAPPVAVSHARRALARGAVGWRGVGEFWQRCRTMDVLDAQTVDDTVFGPLLGDHDVGREKETAQRAELWPEFHRRLSREATRVEGSDAEAARRRRRAAARTRNVSGEINDDGLSSFTVTAGTASVVAAVERIETIARRARKAGDERSLGSLRSDTAMALLLHGTLPLGAGDPAQEGEQPLVPWTEDVRRIVHGLPSAHLDVIVPMSLLVGGGTGVGAAPGLPTASRPEVSGPNPGPSQPAAPPEGNPLGEILGHGFVTGEHARELATLPGSTWHRLLTDPVTGHAVERSSSAYLPDRDMRDHVRAVDRVCRAPGCLIPAHRCELDHEQPFGAAGGATESANLNAKHARHHQLKTERFWTSIMDDTRRVTWTTLFRRTYTTQAHNHRQYDSTRTDTAAAGPTDTEGLTVGNDLRDQLIYAALSARDGQDRWLEAMDDDPEHLDASFVGRPLAIFHRRDGRRRVGPPQGQPSFRQLLKEESAASLPPEPTTAGAPPF